MLKLTDEPIEENFAGTSYCLEPLFQLMVRNNWKQFSKSTWPQFTRITVASFEFQNQEDFFRWRNEKGVTITKVIKPKQYWKNYLKKSKNYNQANIPASIKDEPILMLLILIVYPFRISSDIAK